MQDHVRGWAALCGALVLALLVLGPAAAAASAASPGEQARAAAEKACTKPAPRDDDSIHVTGCLSDTRETPPAPVEGVDISVEDESGKVVGEGASNAAGLELLIDRMRTFKSNAAFLAEIAKAPATGV